LNIIGIMTAVSSSDLPLRDSSSSTPTTTTTTTLPLPPLPPPPPVPDSPDLKPSKRPSTAPGLPLSQVLPPNLTGFSASRASVRKTPTLSNLFDFRGSKRSHSKQQRPSSTQVFSPTNPAPNSALSRPTSKSGSRPSSSRRPPASFSANGIETSFGPPPALITRNSSYQSEILRAQNPAASALATQQQKPYNSFTTTSRRASSSTDKSRDKLTDWAQRKAQVLFSPQPLDPRNMDSLDAVVQRNRGKWTLGPTSPQSFGSNELSPRDMRNHTLKQNSDEGMESSQSSEDLFLKLGNDQPTPESETAELAARLDHMHVSIFDFQL
jgi:hypothetical protein